MKAETKNEKGKVIYTARTRTTGGRDHGVSRSYDGHLDWSYGGVRLFFRASYEVAGIGTRVLRPATLPLALRLRLKADGPVRSV